MIGRAEARKIDIRNVSVMEVILSVIVILVILFYVAEKDHKTKLLESEDHTREKIKNLEETVKNQRKGLADLNAKFRKIKKENVGLRNDVHFYKALASTQKDQQTIDRMEDEYRKISSRTTNGTGGGVDAEKCIVSDDIQEHKWLATINFAEGLVHFIPDKQANSSKLKLVPGLENLTKQSPMTKSKFEQYSKLLLAWSKSNECRFYVRFIKNPLAPQGDLLMVQEYFYTGIR